jgi:hypothetical protein
VGRLREIAAPFVAGAPAGARVRTRLRVSPEDAAVLRAVGSHLGSLAGRDLAARCAEGRLDAKGRAVSRRERKRALTTGSSSRWAGAITRASDDQWQLADRNLHAERASLRARARRVEARAAVPAGGRNGRVPGYATPAERHAKTIRLQALKGRLAGTERRLETGQVSVTRGGRDLLRKRLHLAAAGLTEDQWRREWQAARLFLTADGEASKAWGNETIRFNPDEGWLELKLPAPLAYLANRPHGRYRLSCPVAFSYRGDEVAAQAATGAIRYDITLDPASGRWYLDASWTVPRRPAPALGELRRFPVISVDLNAGHLAVAVVAPDGNVLGAPFTVPGPGRAARRHPRRAAARRDQRPHRHRPPARARAIVIEDLEFTEARNEGRERHGNRPSRGKRGRAFRRMVSGIPTGKLRGRLVQMTYNAGLSVIVVDPAYSSRWGAMHWLAPLREHHPKATGHHAAALVLGRRGLGHRAGRRANGNRAAPEDAARPAPARPRQPPAAGPAPRKPATPRGPRQPPGAKTGSPHRTTAGHQAAQHRPGPPAPQDYALHARLGTVIPSSSMSRKRPACAGFPARATAVVSAINSMTSRSPRMAPAFWAAVSRGRAASYTARCQAAICGGSVPAGPS